MNIQHLNPVLYAAIERNEGFLTMRLVKELCKIDPHQQLLIRCGNGRFSTSAQFVEHFVNIINAEGRDFVRDISFIAPD